MGGVFSRFLCVASEVACVRACACVRDCRQRARSTCGTQFQSHLQAPHRLTKSYLAKSVKDAWMYADRYVPQLKHCWLRNVNKNTRTHTLKMGHWLYTLPTAPLNKSGNTWLGSLRQGRDTCRKQLPGAKQLCKAALNHLGRRVACREIRHNRLKDFLVEYTKTTGVVATSKQAMPQPRDSQPAAREARPVNTTNIHISEPNGTDIWIDVTIGMAKPDRRNAENMGLDRPTQVLFLTGLSR